LDDDREHDDGDPRLLVQNARRNAAHEPTTAVASVEQTKGEVSLRLRQTPATTAFSSMSWVT
jgi:hypothetical protein